MVLRGVARGGFGFGFCRGTALLQNPLKAGCGRVHKLRTIILLLAGIAACYTVLRLADSPQWARRSCFSKGARLFTDNLSEADSLVIERGALRMALQRKGGRWLVTQPLATGADTATVLRFIDCLGRHPGWINCLCTICDAAGCYIAISGLLNRRLGWWYEGR